MKKGQGKVQTIDFGEEFEKLEAHEVEDMFNADEISVYASTIAKE